MVTGSMLVVSSGSSNLTAALFCNDSTTWNSG